MHRVSAMGVAILMAPLVTASTTRAQAPGADSSLTPTLWAIDDILLAESAADFQFSPDNQWLAWVKSAMSEQQGVTAANIWLTRVADGDSWPLTRGTDVNRSPRWSGDGRYLSFLSTRETGDSGSEGSGPQLWILRRGGGEPWPLTTDARKIRAFAWKGTSADSIVFAAEEAPSHLERVRKRAKDTGFAVEDTVATPPVRLWIVSVQQRSVQRLTDNRDWIRAMAISPDGRRAVIRAEVSLSYEFDQRIPPATRLVDLETGAERRILTASRPVPSRIEWATDGSGFYFTYEYSTHPLYLIAAVTRVGFFDLATGVTQEVDLEWSRGLGPPGLEVVPSGFIAHLADGVQHRAAQYTRRGNGWRRQMLEGRHVGHLTEAEVSPDGSMIAYVSSTANTPPQPYLARLDGARIKGESQIVTLNPSFAAKRKPQVEIIRWPGARDDEVEGVLYYPLDYRPGRPYPLIVSIHGGPASADLDAWSQSWSRPIVLFNQRGAFVLKPNYHGSANYGLQWVESIADGRYYSLEIPDIENGVSQLIASGLVHPDSVATHGWSNGAILSTELTTRNPERYKAAAVGAGDVEWFSDWGNVDFGAAFDNYYFGTSPLENPQRYLKLSPYFRLDQVRTPTLIVFGTEDRNVPPGQGWSHYRALQQLGNAPVRFILFPGEPHGLRKLAHQRRKVEEELAWFDRYLWGRPDTVNLAIAAGSPLARRLRRSTASMVDGLFGVHVGGVLAPETVPRDRLEIGRFEVTRAQWREYDSSYAIAPGTENYPVNGVSFERAKAYVAWLSQQSRQRYRLPREGELRPLAATAAAGVTLDYWAGYTPTPEDAARLQAATTRLSTDAPLLMPVGSIAADVTPDAPPLYDLGGNVAEWAVAGDGTGVLVGLSADRPRHPADAHQDAGSAYRGLRVVLER